MGAVTKLEKQCALGLDVGGTKIAGGLVVWPTGEILCRRTLPTAADRGGEAVLEDVIALARQLDREARKNSWRVLGAGLGVAELVDAAGRVTSAHTIHWEGLPIREFLSDVAKPAERTTSRARSSLSRAVNTSSVTDPEAVIVGGGRGLRGPEKIADRGDD